MTGPIQRLWRRLFWRIERIEELEAQVASLLRREPDSELELRQAAELREQARRIADLESSLDAARREVSVLQCEAQTQAEVLARNLTRIKAETAEAARRIAEAER